MIPVYVLSKGRAGRSQTMKMLDGIQRPYYMLVPESETHLYQGHYRGTPIFQPEVATVAQVRNCILSHAREQGYGWVWMLDDDIDALYTAVKGKCTRASWNVLEESEAKFVHRRSVAQVGFEFQNIAWTHEKPVVWNSYCSAVMAINVGSQNHCYTEHLRFWEDCDYTLKLLADGFITMRLTRYAFSSSSDGTNPGGMFEEYKKHNSMEYSHWMINKWGKDICSLRTDKRGRTVLKLNWSYFNLEKTEQHAAR